MQSEAQLQSKCFQWAYNTYPFLRGLLFSVPNGGTRNVREGMTLKATGTTAGIPDMICLYRGIVGFEFKSETGTVSPVQKKIHEIWRSNYIPVHIITTEQQFQSILKEVV